MDNLELAESIQHNLKTYKGPLRSDILLAIIEEQVQTLVKQLEEEG